MCRVNGDSSKSTQGTHSGLTLLELVLMTFGGSAAPLLNIALFKT